MGSPATEQQDTKSENIGDMLSETFDAMEAEAEVNEEVEISEEDTETVVEDDETTKTETEDVEVAEVTEVEEKLETEIEAAEESDYNEPAPERWPDDIKAVYNGLPPEARKAMLDGVYKPMQRSHGDAMQLLAKQRQELKPVLDTMERYSEGFKRAGVNPIEVFNTQMAWASHLQQVGPEQGLQDMYKAYGLGEKGGQQKSDVYLTPTERQMKGDQDDLRQQVDSLRQDAQQRISQAYKDQTDANKQEIESSLRAFINEKTPDGNPLHPHVDKVASNIAGIIRGGMVKMTDEYGNTVSMRDRLAQAYTMACDLDASIRTPSVNKGQVNKVKAAQKAGVVTKLPAGQDDADELSTTDFIEKTYDDLARKSA